MKNSRSILKLLRNYRDIANSIKGIGEYQGTVNGYKNKLKHGKPVLEGEINKKRPDHVLFLRGSEENGKPDLELHWLTVTVHQLEMALIQIAKIDIRT